MIHGMTDAERTATRRHIASAERELLAGEWSLLPPKETRAFLADATADPMPPAWQRIDGGDDGQHWRHARTRQTVIQSVARERDGRRWLHVSTSVPGRTPTYEELRIVKNLFIGREREAVQKFPRQSEYFAHAVKVQSDVLHLWCCLDGDVTPDFRKGGAL